MTAAHWRNWARNQIAHPVAIHRPSSEHELTEIVKRAASDGRRTKVVGSGHSFTDIACTDGHLVELSLYNRVLSIDPQERTVTVQAGIRLEDLNVHSSGAGWRCRTSGTSRTRSSRARSRRRPTAPERA